MRGCLAFILFWLSVPALPAQELATLDGKPAIRFLVGHGHLRDYCDGEFLVSADRIAYASFTKPEHSFAYVRSQVEEFKPVHLWGFDYVKLETGGKTYRVGVYPTMGNAFGHRFDFIVQAVKEFAAAYARVEQVEKERAEDPLDDVVRVETPQGPALRFPAGAVRGWWWLPGVKRAPVFDPPEILTYPPIGVLAKGWLEVSAARIRFHSEAGEDPRLDVARSDFKVLGGGGGYPRVVVEDKEGQRYTLIYGTVVEEGPITRKCTDCKPYAALLGPRDSAPLVQALRDGFAGLLARAKPAATTPAR